MPVTVTADYSTINTSTFSAGMCKNGVLEPFPQDFFKFFQISINFLIFMEVYFYGSSSFKRLQINVQRSTFQLNFKPQQAIITVAHK